MSLGSIINIKRIFNISAAFLILFSQIVTSFAFVTTAYATPENKVLICHATDSVKKPYTNPEVPYSAIDGQGQNDHSLHTGPIFDASIHNQQNRGWGDIIPRVVGITEGLNWNQVGIEIWENGCNPVNTGNIKVNKQIDKDGDGIYENKSNDSANDIGFRWGLDNESTDNLMGSTEPNLPAGSEFVINENDSVIEGYEFTGWFTGSQNTCENPSGTTFPVVKVFKDRTRHITLCNQAVVQEPNPGTLTIKKFIDADGDLETTDDRNPKSDWGFTISDNSDYEKVVTTNSTGTTEKQELVAGMYSVEEELEGYSLVSARCENGNGDLVGSKIENIQVDAGEDVVCGFINAPLSSITIKKDAVPNHADDFDFVIRIGERQGEFTLDDDTDGELSNIKIFNDLAPGHYFIREKQNNPTWKLTDIMCNAEVNKSSYGFSVELSYGQNVECTFVNKPAGSISGTKYLTNADGNKDGAPTSGGWTIKLIQGEVVQETTTDKDGNYSFDFLLPGSYVLQEVMSNRQNRQFTQICSPANGVIRPGQIIENQDFCNFKNGKIRGFKWHDKNGNGIRDRHEPLLSGWKIILKDTDDVVLKEVMTKPNGRFVINNIRPGEYKLCEEERNGWMQTFPSGDSVSCHSVVIDESNETEVRTFGNKKLAKLTIVKDSLPNDDQNFCFTVRELEPIDTTLIKPMIIGAPVPDLRCDAILNDGDDLDEEISNSKKFILEPGHKIITEKDVEGWKLDSVICTNGEIIFNAQIKNGKFGKFIGLDLAEGSDWTCTFVNHKEGSVRVTKFNDYDRDGEMDDDEPVLEGWNMNVIGELECDTDYEEIPNINVLFLNSTDKDCDETYSYDRSQSTEENGSTVFDNIHTSEKYMLSEIMQDEWRLSNIYCGKFDPENIDTSNEYEINNETLKPGSTTECYVGNYSSSLNLTKSNNQTATGSPGDIVTYTLTLTVPEDEDEVFNAEVIDLPPENVDVIEGTETANSNKNGVVAVSPTYASPGTWNLGDLVPGEVVTMSYQAKISDTISSGIYPDIAYATAYDDPQNSEDRLLYANADAPDPFVATQIAVDVPVRTLPDTGARLLLAQFIVPIIAIIASVAIMPKQKKGGRA